MVALRKIQIESIMKSFYLIKSQYGFNIGYHIKAVETILFHKFICIHTLKNPSNSVTRVKSR